MRLGVTFPRLASGADRIALREFLQAVEGIGFDGPSEDGRPHWASIVR
jgi:hypothetical protein